ncbi:MULTISPECIES: hypothetical protein [unclassified Caballeronia]|uniref:hypothetical protein n=1 Tax=unclassified Caballeronia TaxID=2646786 RepID=UPI0028542F94|nr:MULTISPECIES: hypothetical protein [unclassified Caballeronia]MDR5813485.1 hypothetical protein [Caballeronia sp. LZ033]MDR5820242.1 hypothetical protein [Caballeronia sp. LZ043]MDR5878059.1 hypothetical protein [Caballeronia sp. LZ032]
MSLPQPGAIRANLVLFAMSVVVTESGALIVLACVGHPGWMAAIATRSVILCLSGMLWRFVRHRARTAFEDARDSGQVVWQRDGVNSRFCVSKACRSGWLVQLHREASGTEKRADNVVIHS